LIEAYRFGDGASGRNGGQLGNGQRAWAEALEAEYGLSRAKALFDMAEEAKAHLLDFAASNAIDIDYMPGQLSVAHKQRYVDDYKRHAEIMASRFGYP
ncbi:FAD-binding oxidoreductase, partial [Mesorhizobium sp. M4B.F.Ca.ET.190.01.1.1]|uniref:FAD-dependent oxidoreductase n=1 Tax=Mesorhizobium sp. M4B.F.Ca.ET.190.01.1.1 TaxID=2563951 RepID=UPI0010935F0D